MYETKPFPCTSCGACCKLAGLVAGFSQPTLTASSQCSHLLPDNTCAIYSTRPTECRIVDNHRENAMACNTLQVLTNTPAKYRLPILQ